MNSLAPRDRKDTELDKLLKLSEQNTMNIDRLTEAFTKRFDGMEKTICILGDEVSNIKGDLDDFKNNSEITDAQAKSLKKAASNRIIFLLHGMHSPEWERYSSRYYSQLWNDAKTYGGVGSCIATTPKREYRRALTYIEQWSPLGSEDAFREKCDEAIAAKIVASQNNI